MPIRSEVSAVEAARRLGIGLDYLYSLLWTRKLAGRKVGRSWRIPESAIAGRLRQTGASSGPAGR
jgi:excisionase family DNA binding protein